ncbi:MAG: ParB/Srx family N-terminal domain-containing protein [Massilimicrobiota timonensis]
MGSVGTTRPGKSLFATTEDVSFNSIKNKTLAETVRLSAKYINLDKLVDNTENRFKVGDTYFLQKSIKRLGQLQPIILVNILDEAGKPTGKYEIKAGSRRFNSLSSIVKEAKENNDETTATRFSEAWCTVLPAGATEEEIQEVIVETNAYNRVIKLDELFVCFDIIFEQDANGEYVSFKEGEDKINYIISAFKDMGYTFGRTAIKEYYKIYFGHPMLRDYFEKGYLTKKQALIIASMPMDMQKEVLEKSNKMTNEEFALYLKTYDKAKPKKTHMKANELVRNVKKISKQINGFNELKIDIDIKEKQEVLTQIAELENTIVQLKQKLK